MATREKAKGGRTLAGAGRRLRQDAETNREYTTPERKRERKADADQPLEPPEGKDPPARRGEDDQGRPIGE